MSAKYKICSGFALIEFINANKDFFRETLKAIISTIYRIYETI